MKPKFRSEKYGGVLKPKFLIVGKIFGETLSHERKPMIIRLLHDAKNSVKSQGAMGEVPQLEREWKSMFEWKSMLRLCAGMKFSME